MSILEIRQEHNAAAGIEVVAPQGEIDISNLSILDQVLSDVLQRRPQRLVVDLNGLVYVDSGGVSSLLRAGHRLSRQGGQLALAGGNRFVRRLLQMTGINHIFPYYDTLPAALGQGPAGEAPARSEALASAAPGAAPENNPARAQFPDGSGSESSGEALSTSR